MDISADPELEQFRADVAAFLDQAPTEEIRRTGRRTTSVFPPFDQVMAWQRILADKGWAAPGWPVEYGGTGWSIEQRLVFAEEYQRRDLPPLLPNGLKMIGPLIIDKGSEEQKKRYLPGILNGEDYWTQGYSEPGSGSDLASLRTTAVRDGDDYIINGSKIWTTLAHRANRMFMLVRTSSDGPKQAGITFLLLDRMDYPGMQVRPIVNLTGEEEQCEVFFEDVRVPQSSRVGEENDGWAISKHLLTYERGASLQAPTMQRHLEKIADAAAQRPGPQGGVLADDPVFARDLGELAAEIASFGHVEMLILSQHPMTADPAMPSMNKVMLSELTQKVTVLMTRVAGIAGVPLQLDALDPASGVDPLGSELDLVAMPYYLNSRATTIYAGTNEVQRGLIARSLTPGRR
ncbi:acyl-CoA dehydrogenase [Epidermidibacterium keratini]|uniref:Acyl-CoA dehydrogenase n=1 Tax=Epidermidibacterium keratini TaxID=1891644 RepID=A0A7L4YL71_9ACTN|nr:acyl-CoA dehydrogenase family protein [Epidermidibacterium keratini]QHB99583.1 acyl-CoA dehydrogenase [Epidermidibacterium keratini]